MTTKFLSLLLAASITTGGGWKRISLDAGNLAITVPSTATVTRERVNWETDRYTVHRTDGVKLLEIMVGGGTVDLKTFTSFCLTHKRAWRSRQSRPFTVVVGHPGVDAVYLTGTVASESDMTMLDKMISSVKFFDGAYCR